MCVCVQCATIGADLFVYSSISHPTCCCRPSLISNSIFNKICSKGNRWKLQGGSGGSGGFGQLLSVAKSLDATPSIVCQYFPASQQQLKDKCNYLFTAMDYQPRAGLNLVFIPFWAKMKAAATWKVQTLKSYNMLSGKRPAGMLSTVLWIVRQPKHGESSLCSFKVAWKD